MSEGFTYDGFMDLMDSVYEGAGDRIEMARWPDETRGEAKRRLMRGVYEADMRAKYHMPPKGFVQIDGKPYSTHNVWHFTNRYGMGGAGRAEELVVGVFKDTPRAMMVECAKESGARLALRLLGQIPGH